MEEEKSSFNKIDMTFINQKTCDGIKDSTPASNFSSFI